MVSVLSRMAHFHIVLAVIILEFDPTNVMQNN